MSDFLDSTFYGNPISAWLIAIAIFAGSVFIAKLSYIIFAKVFKALAKKTKSKLDDIIVDMIEEPIVFALVIGGIWWAFTTLNLPDWLNGFIHQSYFFLITFNIAWFINQFVVVYHYSVLRTTI